MCIRDSMNDVAFDSYKDRALKAILKEVREDIAFLAAGEAPVSYTHLTLPTSDLV